jgi:delta-aminolevulinic acid dehydratase/porphobilinogen synthase
MLIHAANNGVFQLQAAVEETLTSMRRAGQTIYFIYKSHRRYWRYGL